PWPIACETRLAEGCTVVASAPGTDAIRSGAAGRCWMQAQVRLGRLRRPSRIYLVVPPAAGARPLARGTRCSEHRDMTKPSSLLPLCAVALALLPAIRANASDPSSIAAPADAPQVRFNQLGFHPDASKLAVVEGATGAGFEVVRETDGQPVLQGDLSTAARWAPSNRVAAVADVTALPPGRY